MRLQRSTSIALCSLLEAASAPQRQVSVAEISARFGFSAHHVAKVLRQLVRAGLVESTRGAGGGYRFTGNARRLALYDVIALFEDIGEPATRDAEPEHRTDVGQAIARVLGEIDETAKATFRSITIDTMLKLVGRMKTEPPRT
jgi:Rrf2 family protein